MTFLAPIYLVVAAAAAAGVVALHFLARLRPRVVPFPTARFIPERAARAPARAWRPSDLVLLAMRVLALLLAGAAFAGARLQPARRPVARVVALDLSRAVGTLAEARDSARAWLAEGDVLIPFDSAAGTPTVGGDSLAPLRQSDARGSLSAALLGALRAARGLRGRADSVELIIVSPLAAEEWDAASAHVRAAWRGRVRLVRVTAARGDVSLGRGRGVAVRAADDDPVRAGVGLLGRLDAGGSVRIARTGAGAADSAWAAESARVLVRWPADPAGANWPGRARPDTAGAVVAGGTAVVASFARAVAVPDGRVVARWADGEPAATERRAGHGCIRDVAVPVRAEGDLALRESFRRLVAALVSPCGGDRHLAPLSDSSLALLRGGGGLLWAGDLPADGGERDGLAPWLFAAALLLLVAEPLARRAAATGPA